MKVKNPNTSTSAERENAFDSIDIIEVAIRFTFKTFHLPSQECVNALKKDWKAHIYIWAYMSAFICDATDNEVR